MIVILTESEVRQAVEVGVQRHMANMRARIHNAHGLTAEDDNWGANILGASGELAVAKHLGAFWSGAFGNWKSDDVRALQVRTSARENADLRLHPNDPDNRIFVLVTGQYRTFRLVGWLRGDAGKVPEFWRDGAKGRPAFWVPPARLNPMETLEAHEADRLAAAAGG